MKMHRNFWMALGAIPALIASCQTPNEPEIHGADETPKGVEEVHLTQSQLDRLDIKMDTIPMRMMGEFIETTGVLKVPPQNEAAVTAMIGGNVESIEVTEGEKVVRGQVLAYLKHPDIIRVQTDFLRDANAADFLEKEYQRKKSLFEEEIGSGKEFQRTESEYRAADARKRGHEAQLRLLGLDPERILSGQIYDRIPIATPINGFIRHVDIKTGQYVRPETEMFDIVNIDHIHADFMVFEKDAHKVKNGQTVLFSLGAAPRTTYSSVIFSTGKSFDPDPKALHIHAEITKKDSALLPGMAISGKIMTHSNLVSALPTAAVVHDGGIDYIFTVTPPHSSNAEWTFRPVEISTGISDGEWVEIEPHTPLPEDAIVVWNNAYRLLSELQKHGADHH